MDEKTDGSEPTIIRGSSERDRRHWKRDFFTIWGGQSASLFGSSLVQFALVWWITLETESATILAVAFMAAVVPQVVLGPFAGAVVDRSNRKKVMIASDAGIALATVVLASLFWLGAIEVWHIMILLLVRSLGGAFHWPAFMASTSLMVPKKQLARVNGLNQAVFGLANIGGPAAGAVLLVFLPMQWILSIDISTAVVAICTLMVVHVPNPEPSKDREGNSVVRDIKDALIFVRGWPGAMILLLVAMSVNFVFTPTDALLPILTLEHFGGGAEEFAGLQVSIGIGMVLGGVLLGAWGGFKRRMMTVCFGLAAAGLTMLIVGVVPSGWYLVAVLAIFGTGVFISMLNGALMAVMQVAIPADMQGRVFALLGSGSMAMTPLGLAVGGPTADIFGPQVWFVIAGAVTAVLGVVSAFVPTVMSLENGADAPRGMTSEEVDA